MRRWSARTTGTSRGVGPLISFYTAKYRQQSNLFIFKECEIKVYHDEIFSKFLVNSMAKRNGAREEGGGRRKFQTLGIFRN